MHVNYLKSQKLAVMGFFYGKHHGLYIHNGPKFNFYQFKWIIIIIIFFFFRSLQIYNQECTM